MNLSKKIKPTSIALGMLLTGLASSQADVTFYIKQVQEGADGEEGLSADVYVEDAELITENMSSSGTHSALMEVGEHGSTFYLYVQGIGDPDGLPILLDEKFVGRYVASANIEVTSADPYVPTRTRANEPYTVKITSSNQQWYTAVNGGTAPEISWDPTKIRVEATYEKQDRDGLAISSGTIDLNDSGEGTTLSLVAGDTTDIIVSSTNIPADVDPEGTSVPRPSDSSLTGKETFVIQAESDTDVNGNAIYRTVGSGSIQIWPQAQGRISGLIQGEKITRPMPDVDIYLYDLYPNSTTYATIYKGEANLSGNVIPVYTSFKLGPYNQPTPIGSVDAPAVIPVTNWDQYVTEDGIYTLEVDTITPFNDGKPERILAVTLEVDSTIRLVGSTTTSE